MKLKYSLLIALGCYTIHLIAWCLSLFLLNGEEYMTIFNCDRIRGMSFNNISAYFGIFGILGTVFFAISLLKMRSNIKPKILCITVVILKFISAFYSLLFLIAQLHITILYGGQHFIGDWNYWEETGREIAPMLYKILFNDHLYASMWFSSTANVIQNIFNFIINPLTHLLLIVFFCCMKKLMQLSRIIGVVTCSLPIIYRIVAIAGVNVYEPMIHQTYLVADRIMWCTMLLLLCINSEKLERNESRKCVKNTGLFLNE